MFESLPNLFIYIALAAGLIFVCYSLYVSKKLPILTDLFSVILAVAAAYSGIELCFLSLDSAKSLGDFENQKLVIILGGVAVFWVSLLTVISSVNQVKRRTVSSRD